MKKKSKGKEQVEQMIVRGHKMGVCDSEGNSVHSNGYPTARPKKINPGLRIRYYKTHKEVYKDGEWTRCEY